MDGPGLHLEGPTDVLLGELDVLLALLVAALDLDPRLEADVEPLDPLVHGAALEPHLTLDDPAGDDVRLGQLRLDGRAPGTHAREQLLEAHIYSF